MKAIYLRRLFLAIGVALCWMGLASGAPAQAASPLAVYQSERNEEVYSEQHLQNYDEAWRGFIQTLENANFRFDTLSDKEVSGGQAKLKDYKLIIVPLLVDIPADDANALTDYMKAGGKVIITDGGGDLGQNGQSIAKLAGVQVTNHTTSKDSGQLVWKRDPLPVTQDFPVGTLVATVTPAEDATVVANWQDAAGTTTGAAIVRRNPGFYLTWAPGLQGQISSNASLITMAMDDLVPGISQQAAVQISYADYQSITSELDYLTKRTEETIKTARQADLAVPFKNIQQDYDSAMAHVKAFVDAYQGREFYKADDELNQARRDFSLAFAQSMPVRPVEARCVWLDRGTIVAAHNEAGMAALFDKLKAAGINVVYFETNNAGFCTFPTKVSTQNPETLGWDPLGTAVREAHKRGMELHAWFWIFAVGNIRHNPIIGKEADFPGPVLSNHDMSWALQGTNGNLNPKFQGEFWIDPANPTGRQFIKDLITEVATTYPVDGVMYDYIRYPFHSNTKGREMGYDWVGRTRFEQETGLSVDNLDDEGHKLWQAWKVQQVNNFVQDVSTSLKRLKPGFRISAAVYGMPKPLRVQQIMQEWETWVANGWVDTINPMTYVETANALAIAAGGARESTGDESLVYPGLSIRQLDTAGLIEQLDTARVIGTLGTTMFAVAQLDDKKQQILKVGPYRKQPLLTPQSQPVRASRMLIDDFAAMVNRYLQDPKKHILSDQKSTNDVLSQLVQIQRQMHQLPDNAGCADLESVKSEIDSLHSNVKEWLRLEAFIQRGYRAQYIANYLSQVEAILSYAAHKAKTESQLVAGSGG